MPTSIIFLKVQDFQIGAKNSNPSTSQVFFENWQSKLGELLSLELQKVIICRDLCYLWNPKLINYCSQFELTLAILYHWNVHKLCTLQVSPVFHLSLSLSIFWLKTAMAILIVLLFVCFSVYYKVARSKLFQYIFVIYRLWSIFF